MNLFSELRHRLRALLRRSTVERELEDELQFHLDREAERQDDGGAATEESRRRARLAFGGLEVWKEACRDERGTWPVEQAGQDLRYALRTFRRMPAFSVAVVLTLGLGIGATTTVFGIVDGVLIRPLPYAESERLVQIGTIFGGSVRVSAVSAPDAIDIGRRARAIEALALSRARPVDVTGDGLVPERVTAAEVTAVYFDILGVAPDAGRVLANDDQQAGGIRAAVLGRGLADRRFGTADAVGRRLQLNGIEHVVVGVMPARFRGPEALGERDVAIWVPRADDPAAAFGDRDAANWTALARLAAGADLDGARRDLDALGEAIGRDSGADAPRRFWTATLQEETVGDAARQLWLLLAAVGVLLAIACANVAHLFLVRATERTREMVVRLAIGAGRGRIVRQLLTESVVLALGGGLLGVLLAYAGIGLFKAFGPADLPRLADVIVDTRVLAFSLAVSAAAGVVFGLVPALEVTRLRLAGPLRSTAAQVTGTRASLRVREALIIAQTGLAVTLLVGASLLVNSLWRLGHVAPGFEIDDVVWMNVRLPQQYANADSRLLFFDDLLARAGVLNGVVAVGGIEGRPLGGGNAVATMLPETSDVREDTPAPRHPLHSVTPGYFRAMGIPIVDGRDFESGDRGASPRVAIVSRAMAREFWPNERAVGRRFWIGRVAPDAPLVTVVGVAEDVRQYNLAEAGPPMAYRPVGQGPRPALTIVARHDGRSARQVLEQMREATWRIDPLLPLDEMGTMREQLRASIAAPRFRAAALAVFSVVAAALASIGLYATLSWMVRTRRRELGIRLALGASPGALRTLVFTRGLVTTAVGVVMGTALARLASRALDSLVFGITTRDALTFAAAAMLMTLVAAIACWVPARQAAATDPSATLRE